ncbi:hypothetical protein LINGRAHAP2_LOCUS6013 [Linum grandiflorum]
MSVVFVIIVVLSFSSLSSPVSASSFSNEVCYGANAPDYSQVATEIALDNIMEDIREYPSYVLFCADGNKENYYMHAQAGCDGTPGCYGCVQQAKDYLSNKCGKRLGAHVSEDTGRCYIRFENYHIDNCP